MINQKKTTKMDTLFISTLITLSGFTASAMAQSSQRDSSIPQHMLNKVVKKKYQKSASQKKTSKKIRLSFDPKVLTSEYASWGTEPSNKKSSINLVPAWKVFKKKKDIVVAVVDTGIDPQHPFLKDNIYVTKGSASSSNYGISDFMEIKYICLGGMDS